MSESSDWVVNVLGHPEKGAWEVSLVRKSFQQGLTSYGWEGPDKIILNCSDGHPEYRVGGKYHHFGVAHMESMIQMANDLRLRLPTTAAKSVWYHPAANILGVVTGDFIEFPWNGATEESYFPILRDEGHWVYVGKL